MDKLLQKGDRPRVWLSGMASKGLLSPLLFSSAMLNCGRINSHPSGIDLLHFQNQLLKLTGFQRDALSAAQNDITGIGVLADFLFGNDLIRFGQ
jgi:hypothetical protein